MIRFYDKQDNKYFEFVYIDTETLKLNSNIIFITDTTTIDEIEKIDHFLRRFIKFNNNQPSVDYAELKNDILIQLKIYRENAFKYLDGKFFQLNEKLLIENDASVIKQCKEELINIIKLKDKWRNIELHKEFDNLKIIKSYSEIINAIRKDIDPLYVNNSNEEVSNVPNI